MRAVFEHFTEHALNHFLHQLPAPSLWDGMAVFNQCGGGSLSTPHFSLDMCMMSHLPIVLHSDRSHFRAMTVRLQPEQQKPSKYLTQKERNAGCEAKRDSEEAQRFATAESHFHPKAGGAKGKGDFSGTQELGSPGRHRHHHKPVAGAGSCDTMLLTERALRRREQFLLLLSSPPISSQWLNEPRQPGKCNL